MQLTVKVQNQQELQLILQYLKSLPGVQVVPGNLAPMGASTPPDAATVHKKDFSKYWGCMRTKVSMAEIDQRLNDMRNQWERVI